MVEDAMPVARWEFHSLAVMLVATHADDAEAEVARRYDAAQASDDRGQMVVWTEVGRLLDEVRAVKRVSDQ